MTAEVEVWRIPLSGAPEPEAEDRDSALEELLDDDERSRARMGKVPGMRRRFVRSHAAARIIIGARLGRAPRAVRFTRGRWGKPLVEDAGGVHFSLSHSGETALLALAPRPVGVDVELTRADLDAGRLARRFFPQRERELVERAGHGAFVRLWTRKEACVKAAGARLTQGMGVPVAHTAPQAVVHDPTGPLQGPWRVVDLALPARYAGAVALLGDGPFSVSPRMWYDMLAEESDVMSAILGVK
ncbi:4'-phosphopantetheinyl transferase superfamily protein [Streptomyces sp. AC512_CC834]|uniref:4'-phosphopantetheinyl transferase family protein n=1 Tax=Streptomyces sp. AC512_CC834 TaxID=2823691 RepID=UPI001C276CDD|nr:4'-phosphopantetheinyl transferase superfamily protein [Streptomyces sp. AC512_CC834]